ncbi:hypothetical protein L0668_14995 [Paraglaciecola aquimarina]|uniref:DUF4440 domain-containing protein n=1 Tax=Paraglaciecola algarum TaxID=3050085 RepID=A0ABS9DAL3_9ALTE|nr:hypothetical protein [Paraglaciecola sp. G1-23]MCF2949425.1 hypothetical protein [Paraglaciecola sp. G1-23]
MKNLHLLPMVLSVICICLLSNSAQAQNNSKTTNVEKHIAQSINNINQHWQTNLQKGHVAKVLEHYAEKAIFMPEYQPTLNGAQQIKDYLTALNKQRKFHQINYQSTEMLKLGKYVLEIGNFDMDVQWLNHTSTKTYTGKYWRIWDTDSGVKKELQIIGEAFGFYKHLENPELWVTDRKTRAGLSPSGFKATDMSIELQAYHSLGQKGVKQKDGELRAKMYAQDAVFYPFADTPKKGMEVLKPYLIQYSSHGAIIESVKTYSHEVIYLDGFILEFAKFAVAWTYDGVPGSANGKGISLRKRLENGELRFFRHIGMHNYDGY